MRCLRFHSLTPVEKPKETQTPAEKCPVTPVAKTAPLSNPVTVSVQESLWLGIYDPRLFKLIHSLDASDRPGAPKAELCRDLSKDKRGTHTAASCRAPTSHLHRRRHQNPRLCRTQMQRSREHQRDTKMPSGYRRWRDRGHHFRPPILRIRHCFRKPMGTICLPGLLKSSLTHHLHEYTHRQLVTGIRAYRQKHLCVKGLSFFV